MRKILDTGLFLSEGTGLLDDCRARRLPLALVVLEAGLAPDTQGKDPQLLAALRSRMEARLRAIAAGPGLAACLGGGVFALLLPRTSPRQALHLVALELGPALSVQVDPQRSVAFAMVARPLEGPVLESALLGLLADAEARLPSVREDGALPVHA